MTAAWIANGMSPTAMGNIKSVQNYFPWNTYFMVKETSDSEAFEFKPENSFSKI